ncbi:disease resistance protein RPM1-like [Primulina huaijiensis]|uniref:disease resistance protein RPM1-like n=1 Tax=Primulina huaijiensis TaxID=1492673 RepID=UPI003CC78227
MARSMIDNIPRAIEFTASTHLWRFPQLRIPLHKRSESPNIFTHVKESNLQVANCLEANVEIVKGLGELSQLRRIELTNLKAEKGKDLCASIEKMKRLHRLLLMTSDENEYLQVEQLSSVPLVLRNLTLVGRLNSQHRSSVVPITPNVLHLHLHWSQLTNDPIPYISNLPVLESVTLINANSHDKKQLNFNEGFSRL